MVAEMAAQSDKDEEDRMHGSRGAHSQDTFLLPWGSNLSTQVNESHALCFYCGLQRRAQQPKDRCQRFPRHRSDMQKGGLCDPPAHKETLKEKGTGRDGP